MDSLPMLSRFSKCSSPRHDGARRPLSPNLRAAMAGLRPPIVCGRGRAIARQRADDPRERAQHVPPQKRRELRVLCGVALHREQLL